jgi:hypothetical protein
VPVDATRLTLNLASNMMVMARNPANRLVIALTPSSEPAEIDIDVPMMRAVVAQPRYKGRVIRPQDLAKPEVRAEFVRQMNEINHAVLPPPDAVTADVTASIEP